MLYIYFTTLFIYRGSIWYKRIFNASIYSITLGVSSYLFHKFYPSNFESSDLYSITFFMLVIILTIYYKASNYILIFIVVSLERGKFDIDIIIGFFNTTKTAFATFFVGLINIVLFYYTNLIGVTIFTFILFFFKPALRYRQIFENELSTFTSFVLHIIKQMDPITHSHSERVKFWTILLAEKKGLTSTEIRQLSQAASWHDIGKIEIPVSILNKPSPLLEEEYEIVKIHPEQGYQLVKDMEFFKKFLPVIRHHHERYDGKGYPLGLLGDNIPLHARIMAITDAFDAMTSDRSYRKALDINIAVKELATFSGTQFDPLLVQVFIEALQDKYGMNFERYNQETIMGVI